VVAVVPCARTVRLREGQGTKRGFKDSEDIFDGTRIKVKEYKVQQAQTTKDEKKFEKDGGTQNSHDGLPPNVKAYKLFS
jgi:hypothetical protein